MLIMESPEYLEIEQQLQEHDLIETKKVTIYDRCQRNENKEQKEVATPILGQ